VGMTLDLSKNEQAEELIRVIAGCYYDQSVFGNKKTEQKRGSVFLWGFTFQPLNTFVYFLNPQAVKNSDLSAGSFSYWPRQKVVRVTGECSRTPRISTHKWWASR
jgi:hypothetical protein